jgi:DEAD/DEAH box helicase domain-containing protein
MASPPRAAELENAADPRWSGVLEAGLEDERLVHHAVRPPSSAATAKLPDELQPELRSALVRNGVDELYVHQAEAYEAAAGGPVIVTTGTASGKSLAFNLPVLDRLVADPKSRALYVYPTKALAQDQARALAALQLSNLRPAIYDGDTPRRERPQIRKRANLILTNPDMLHVGILPNHPAWGDALTNLAAVVIDEAHVYRGVFGSHMGNVLRRLRRIARTYGSDPLFLLASATIANPLDLAEGLTGFDDFTLVDRDGSPQATRETVMWNPPLVDEDLGLRASALGEASELLAGLVAREVRTICFIKSRRAVELIAKFTADRLRDRDPDLAARVAPYRAGYTPQQRRELERRLVEGELLGVVATDALELGIDIGALDAAICVTFPGTVASLRQMWGRAGRRGRGLALYVAGEDALDQFFCRHPDQFLDRPVEAAILDHESEEIHARHLVCAAHEGPLEPGEAEVLSPRWQAMADRLVEAGELRRRGDAYVPAHPGEYPAAALSLRSASSDAFAVVDAESGEMLGTVDAARAFKTVHDGAVYLHMGRSYEVRALDLDARHAIVTQHTGDWYTQPRSETDTTIEQLLDRRETMGVTLSYGAVSVTDTVLGYQRKRYADHEAVEFVSLDLPSTTFTTKALWYELDDEVLGRGAMEIATGGAEFPLEELLGSLHAVEHAQIAVLPLIAMCDRWDIGGLSTNFHPQTGRPTIFIYDGHPGGVGITRRGFAEFETLAGDAHRLISECPCRDGCPSCVQSPKCGNLNEPLSKHGAIEVLVRMLER